MALAEDGAANAASSSKAAMLESVFGPEHCPAPLSLVRHRMEPPPHEAKRRAPGTEATCAPRTDEKLSRSSSPCFQPLTLFGKLEIQAENQVPHNVGR